MTEMCPAELRSPKAFLKQGLELQLNRKKSGYSIKSNSSNPRTENWCSFSRTLKTWWLTNWNKRG